VSPPAVARRSRCLLRHGAFLLLLGLLTGFLTPVIENPHMGLLSHFEGILNGILLIALGLVWPRLRLAPAALTTAYWLGLYGAYMSWATTLFTAWLGVGTWLPVAAGEETHDDWEKALIQFGLLSFAVSLVVLSWILIWGLREAGEKQAPPAEAGAGSAG
jgi:hydroxylaminobenzene mutase